MQEIDAMDMPGFLKIRAWNAKKANENAKPKHAYIDQVWTSVRP